MMKLTKLLFVAVIVGFTSVSAMALNPSRTYKQTPDKYNMKFEQVTVKVDNDVSLNAWYFPGQSAKGKDMIVISHSGEGNMGDYLRVVNQFISMDYRVLIYDYRGYGESSEYEIDNSLYIDPYFQQDLEAVIAHVSAKYTSKFNLYGFGVGAGLSLGIGYNRREIKKVVADEPFLSMSWAEKNQDLEIPFAGYDKRNEPIYTLDEDPSPTFEKALIICGGTSSFCNEETAKELKKKNKKLIEIYVAEGGSGWETNFSSDREAYFTAIREFLES